MNGSDATAAGLPFLRAPHDVLRDGLPTLKEDARVVHPVEAVQKQASPYAIPQREALASLYGRAFVAQMDIERQILSRRAGTAASRPPAQRAGQLERFDFDSYLGTPANRVDEMPGSLHTQMEARLGLGGASKAPLRPGL